MSLDQLFWIAHIPAVIGWITLLAAPIVGRRAVTIARGAAILLALTYLSLFLAHPDGLKGLATDYSLAGIGTLFGDPRVLLLGWVHYLAFDLWVASWEAEAGREAGLPHLFVAPCMLLTFMLGPLGLLLFLLVRAVRGRRSTG